MTKFNQLKEVLNEVKQLEDIEKSYDTYLEEIGKSHLKCCDTIAYQVGLSEYENNIVFRGEERLNEIDYRGKNEETLFLIKEILNHL